MAQKKSQKLLAAMTAVSSDRDERVELEEASSVRKLALREHVDSAQASMNKIAKLIDIPPHYCGAVEEELATGVSHLLASLLQVRELARELTCISERRSALDAIDAAEQVSASIVGPL